MTGGGAAVVVVVVVVVVVDVVVEVDVDVDVEVELVAVVRAFDDNGDDGSSRPWNTNAEAETAATTTTSTAPITTPRMPIRPIRFASAPAGPRLSSPAPLEQARSGGPARAQPFFGISRNGLPLSALGSLGSPRTRSPRMLCWISSVPP